MGKCNEGESLTLVEEEDFALDEEGEPRRLCLHHLSSFDWRFYLKIRLVDKQKWVQRRGKILFSSVSHYILKIKFYFEDYIYIYILSGPLGTLTPRRTLISYTHRPLPTGCVPTPRENRILSPPTSRERWSLPRPPPGHQIPRRRPRRRPAPCSRRGEASGSSPS